MMNENIEELKDLFTNIKKKGWIKSKGKGNSAIGRTFEYLLNKEEDSFEIPDFAGIELKTTRKVTNQNIGLFNANPDGTYLFEAERIRMNYGYPSECKRFKIFCTSIYAHQIHLIKQNNFEIKVNYKEEKVVLHISKPNLVVDDTTFWSFDLLKEKLERKLNYLALVEAKYMVIDSIEYFKYEKMTIYKNVNFNSFINLIDNGKVGVSFKMSAFKSGARYGQVHNHGTGFTILSDFLPDMYSAVEKVD
ncbi:MAG: MvaI/BcnI family restriction endonuclease [Bacilli bacterium]